MMTRRKLLGGAASACAVAAAGPLVALAPAPVEALPVPTARFHVYVLWSDGSREWGNLSSAKRARAHIERHAAIMGRPAHLVFENRWTA